MRWLVALALAVGMANGVAGTLAVQHWQRSHTDDTARYCVQLDDWHHVCSRSPLEIKARWL